MPGVNLEREVKLGFDSVDEAREAVLAAGATPLRARRLQEDALLDTADGCLRQRRCVLRIRTEGAMSRVAFKGPTQPSPFKTREEIETVVGDSATLLQLFAELGFTPSFRYQKYREEFAREDVIVAIDETPVGVFVEIEGSAAGIDAMAAALGRGPDDYIVQSYRTLFLASGDGREARDMLFEEP